MRLNFPEVEVWEMAESCSLDVADRGSATLEEVTVVLNLNRDQVRAIELRAVARIVWALLREAGQTNSAALAPSSRTPNTQDPQPGVNVNASRGASSSTSSHATSAFDPVVEWFRLTGRTTSRWPSAE
jgi:hypothetical protein